MRGSAGRDHAHTRGTVDLGFINRHSDIRGTGVGSIRMEPRLWVWQNRASVWQVRRTYSEIGGRMASLGGRMAEMGRRMAGLPYV